MLYTVTDKQDGFGNIQYCGHVAQDKQVHI